MFLSRRLFGEGPRQHELGLEHSAGLFDDAIERCCHPFVDGMAYSPLDVLDGLTGGALIPGAVQLFGDGAELNSEIIRKVRRFDLAALLSPETNEVGIVFAHDDAGIRS